MHRLYLFQITKKNAGIKLAEVCRNVERNKLCTSKYAIKLLKADIDSKGRAKLIKLHKDTWKAHYTLHNLIKKDKAQKPVTNMWKWSILREI